MFKFHSENVLSFPLLSWLFALCGKKQVNSCILHTCSPLLHSSALEFWCTKSTNQDECRSERGGWGHSQACRRVLCKVESEVLLTRNIPSETDAVPWIEHAALRGRDREWAVRQVVLGTLDGMWTAWPSLCCLIEPTLTWNHLLQSTFGSRGISAL